MGLPGSWLVSRQRGSTRTVQRCAARIPTKLKGNDVPFLACNTVLEIELSPHEICAVRRVSRILPVLVHTVQTNMLCTWQNFSNICDYAGVSISTCIRVSHINVKLES